jgi:hypothetical protein
MIVAINKIDKPGANVEATKKALYDAGVQVLFVQAIMLFVCRMQEVLGLKQMRWVCKAIQIGAGEGLPWCYARALGCNVGERGGQTTSKIVLGSLWFATFFIFP